MNKNVEKTMSRALSATLALGVVSAAVPVSAKTATSYYNDAKAAVASAKSKGTQAYIDKASKAIATLKAKTTLDNSAKVKALVSDLNKAQNAVYSKVSSAISKFQKSQNKADYDAAKKLVDTLKASASTDVKSKAASYQKSLDAARATVKSVVSPAGQAVDFGTKASELKLPTTVNVTLSNGTTTNANVKWDTDKFDGTKAGKNTIPGTLTVPTTKYYKLGTAAASIDVTVGSLNVKSLTATGAKAFKVTFNGPVADTSKVSFSLKKGTIDANLSGAATWNADKTEATLATSTKITAGAYTVTASGIELGTATASVTAENEKVAKIEIASDKAALDATGRYATVSYKISNQYGEDVTSIYASGLRATAGTGTATAGTDGVITLDAGASNTYTKGAQVALSLIDPSTTTFATRTITVSDKAAVADLNITGMYNVDNATLDESITDLSKYELIVDAKDQYGNAVAAANIAGDVIVTSSDSTQVQTAASFTTDTINGKTQTVLKLANGTGTLTAGTYTVTILSKTTGHKAQYNVVVAEKTKTDVISLSAPELAVAGEKVVIPFSVTDKKGNELTSYSALNGNITFSDPNASFVKDYSTGKAKLVYDASALTAAQKVTFTATTATGKVAVLTVSFQDPAYAAVVSGISSDVVTNVAIDGMFTLNKDNITVKDQYGRAFDLTGKMAAVAAAGKYRVVVSKVVTGDTATQLNGTAADTANIAADGDKVDVTGKVKGTSGLTIKVQKSVNTGTVAVPVYTFQDVTGSDYSFNVGISEKTEFTSYELKDFTPIYDNTGAAYQESVVVYGVKANGAKVVLPTSLYTVSTNNIALTYSDTNGKLTANDVVNDTDLKDVTAKVTVIVDGVDAPVTLTKDVTVTQPTLKAATSKWATTANVTLNNGVLEVSAANATRANLEGALTFLDQFGGSFTDANETISFTNLVDADKDGLLAIKAATKNGTTTADLQGVEANDTFTITIVSGGTAYTMPVVVTQ